MEAYKGIIEQVCAQLKFESRLGAVVGLLVLRDEAFTSTQNPGRLDCSALFGPVSCFNPL